MIYLDNAATTFPKPNEVLDYVDWVQRNIAVNVGRGSYSVAKEAMSIVEEGKAELASFVRANSMHDVFFLPSATIAANQIIMGLEWDNLKNVYVTPFEHNAIMRPLEMIRAKYGVNIFEIPFDPVTQELDEEEMLRAFSLNNPDYVFVNQISNVTGTIVPVDSISFAAKKYNALITVDGSQSVGLERIDLQSLGIDYLIFAGHKNLYASWGIGGFIRNSDYQLRPVLAGGTGSDSLNLTMSGFEMGSPNIIAIASLKKSLEWLEQIGIDTIADHKQRLMNMLIDGLDQCGAKLYIPTNKARHTSVLSFNVEGYSPAELGMILDQDYEIAVRTGYHCAPLVHKLIGTEETQGTVRASLSFFNTEEDIGRLVDAIREI